MKTATAAKFLESAAAALEWVEAGEVVWDGVAIVRQRELARAEGLTVGP